MFFHKKKRKKKGYILFETVLAIIVFGMLSIAFFMIFSGQFSMINSSRDALQAQQYAQVEAEMLRVSEYEDLQSKVKSRSPMTSWANPGNIWESSISLDSEKKTTVGKTRIAHVSVYRQGDTLARFTLDVPLSSQVMSAYVRNENYSGNNTQDSHSETVQEGQISMYYDGKRIHTYFKDENGNKKEVDNMENGTIMAYLGNLSDIPDGWHLCDGTNGTTDLRGMFLRGYGEQSHTKKNQVNGRAFNPDTTVHKSGAIGEIQGDTTRNWIWSIDNVFRISYGNLYSAEHNIDLSQIGWNTWRTNSIWAANNGTGSVWNGKQIAHENGGIPIYLGTNPAWYRYRPKMQTITVSMPCGSTSFQAVTGLEEYIDASCALKDPPYSFLSPTSVRGSVTSYGYTAAMDLPTDNEIRPVNRAVYFIQKIGT